MILSFDGLTRIGKLAYQQNDTVILHMPSILTSGVSLLLGVCFIASALILTVFANIDDLLSQEAVPVLSLTSGIELVVGVILIITGSFYVHKRKQAGGIYEKDPVYILDGTTKTVKLQRNGEEQFLCTFEEMRLSVQEDFREHRNQFYVSLYLPHNKKVIIERFTEHDGAFALLKKLQDILHLSV